MRASRAASPASATGAEIEDVVARDVEHRLLDLLSWRRPGGNSSASFWIFLPGGEQVALYPVGEKADRGLVGALLLQREPLPDPCRQRGAADRTGIDRGEVWDGLLALGMRFTTAAPRPRRAQTR